MATVPKLTLTYTEKHFERKKLLEKFRKFVICAEEK